MTNQIDILSLKDDVVENFKTRLQEEQVNPGTGSLYVTDIDAALTSAIESTLDALHGELPDEAYDQAADLLFHHIAETEKGDIVMELTEEYKDHLAYQQNPLAYHGLSERDFYE